MFSLQFRRNGTPPLCEVPPFEINNENYFLLIGLFYTVITIFGVAPSVERFASNLWVKGSNLARVLIFITCEIL